jgi:hypothetical protein
LQFALPARNGVGVQAGDLCKESDTSATVLLGEEADEEASRAFVGGSDEAIDPPMLSSQSAVGMLLAGKAGTHMDGTWQMLLRHGTVPPWGNP